MPVTILDPAVGVGDNNTNPINPSAGTDRGYALAVFREGAWADVALTLTAAGDTDATLTRIATLQGPTFRIGLYLAIDADMGENLSTANGSLTYSSGTPASSSIVVVGATVQGLHQTTPYTDTEDIGWSLDATNNTEDCPFTLDATVDALGLAFFACSKTNTTWTITDNGYAASGSGQWTNSTATAANAAAKEILTQVLAQLTTFTSGLSSDKTATAAIMLLPADSGPDVTPDIFDFTDQTDLDVSTLIESDIETVTGIDAPADISVVGGEFRIDGGSWTSSATTISNNSTVQLRQTTSDFGGAKTTVTLTVGTIGVDWNTTTSVLAKLDGLVENYTTSGNVLSFGHALTNTSGGTFKEDTGQVAIIRNGVRIVYLYDLGDYDNIIKTIDLTLDGTDTEGICDMGNGEFATCSEDGGRQQVNIYDWPTGTTAASKQELTLGPTLGDTNSGPEGICYDRVNKTFYVCVEGEQTSTERAVLKFVRPTNTTTDYTYTDPELTVEVAFDAEVAFDSLGTSGATFDLSDMDFDNATGNLVFASHTGEAVVQVNKDTGAIISVLDVSNDGFTQIEIVVILPNGEVMTGGEAFEYRIYEYVAPGPTTTPKSINYTAIGTASLSLVTTFQIQPNMTVTGSLTLIKSIMKFFGMTATGSSTIQKTISKSIDITAIGTATQQEGLVVDQTANQTATGTLNTATSLIISIGGTIKRISRAIVRNIVRNIVKLIGG